MAIFSCTTTDAHASLPRRHSYAGRPSLAKAYSANGISANGHAASTPHLHGDHRANGQIQLKTSPMARQMASRNGSKLKKRPRVTKTIVGNPTGFRHIAHYNRAEVLSNNALADITCALQDTPISPLDTIRVETQLQQPTRATTAMSKALASASESEAKRPQMDDTPTAGSSPEAIPRKPTVNRRKAPPPITASIIKAAGLPSPDLSANPVPASKGTVSRSSNTRITGPGSSRSPPRTKLTKASRDSKLLPIDIFPSTSGNGNLPGVRSELAGHEDVTTASSNESPKAADLSSKNLNGLETIFNSPGAVAVEGLPGALTSPSLINETYEKKNKVGVESASVQTAASGTFTSYIESQTIQEGRNSQPGARQGPTPSWVTTGNVSGAGLPQESAAPPNNGRAGPLDYMTDTTKAKWNTGMAEIAKQLRDEVI